MSNLIYLHDTSIFSDNLGDQIIMKFINSEILSLFPNAEIWRSPTHCKSNKFIRSKYKVSDYAIVCGTNLLSSNILNYRQFKLSFRDFVTYEKSILLGVGWWKYQSAPDIISTLFWRKILNQDRIHSVRDEYSKKMLASVGIKSIGNTSCPTLWGINNKDFDESENKYQKAIFTLTDYNRNTVRDTKFITSIREMYDELYFWPQGIYDLDYLKQLFPNYNKFNILGRNLNSLDEILSSEKVDYIGTRLHAGINALNFGQRSFILGIDNRSIEIGRDVNLPVVSVNSLDRLEDVITSEFKLKVKLPHQEISNWRQQFSR